MFELGTIVKQRWITNEHEQLYEIIGYIIDRRKEIVEARGIAYILKHYNQDNNELGCWASEDRVYEPLPQLKAVYLTGGRSEWKVT